MGQTIFLYATHTCMSYFATPYMRQLFSYHSRVPCGKGPNSSLQTFTQFPVLSTLKTVVDAC